MQTTSQKADLSARPAPFPLPFWEKRSWAGRELASDSFVAKLKMLNILPKVTATKKLNIMWRLNVQWPSHFLSVPAPAFSPSQPLLNASARLTVQYMDTEGNTIKAQNWSNFLKQCTDVEAKTHPQNMYKSKTHSLVYLHSTSSQFFACAGPNRHLVS